MPRLLAILLGLLGVSSLLGCNVGRRAGNFPPAQEAAGVQARLDVDGTTLRGELLEVGSIGLLVVVDGEIVRVPFAAIERGDFHKMRKDTEVHAGRPPAATARSELALVSRFPQGVDEALMRRLLAAYGQREVRTWSR